MSARNAMYRYVVDHGDLYRMTERRFGVYLLSRSRDEPPDAAKFGVFIGTALTVNNLGPDDFREEFNKLHGYAPGTKLDNTRGQRKSRTRR